MREWVRGHAAMREAHGIPSTSLVMATDVPGSALKLLLLRGLSTPLGVVITRGEGCDQRLPW